MKVLVTGAEGFIAKNLIVRLQEAHFEVIRFNRDSQKNSLLENISKVDFIFHLAGVNRPSNILDFNEGNSEFTKYLCKCVQASNRNTPIVFASSIQAEQNNPYGFSKLQAEYHLEKLSHATQSGVAIYRLPNVFGKWSKPNYNSVVATFCYNVINNIPLEIHDKSSVVNLLYIDDLIDDFLRIINTQMKGVRRLSVHPQYTVTIEDLAGIIESFKHDKAQKVVSEVGYGLSRALYATYLSFYKPSDFKSNLEMHLDSRGVFVEMLKTKKSGQISFFTAHPSVTRGEHYHHTKNEKFLVVHGVAKFKFRHILTNEIYELTVSSSKSEIIETVPGWAHDITNIGQDEMIVIIWSNEVFDKKYPDTITCRI